MVMRSRVSGRRSQVNCTSGGCDGGRRFSRTGIWTFGRRALISRCDLYALTRRFPPSERYGDVGPDSAGGGFDSANIAEGLGQERIRELPQRLSHARGSLRELETLLLIARRVGYLARPTTYVALADAN